MYLVMSMLFLVVFLTPLAIIKKDNRDLLSPLKINAMIHIFTIVPYLIIYQFNNEIVGVNLLLRFKDIDSLFMKYFILQSVSYYLIVAGIFSRTPKKLAKRLPKFNQEISTSRYTVAVIISFTIGLASYFYLMSKTGGIVFFLKNIEARTFLREGLGYHSLLIQFMTFGALLLLYSFKFKSSFFKWIMVIFLLVVTIILESMFGGRKDTVYLIFFAILIYHYTIQKIKLINWRLIIPVLFIILYFLTIPILRTDGAIEYYSTNPEHLVNDVLEEPVNQINGFSYVRHYLLVLDEFNYNNIWLGRSYLNLLYAPVPRSYYENKPPIDDGVYLRSIAAGYDVEPDSPYNKLFQSSWPTESFGSLYMNFWIPGLFIGMFFIGFIYRTLYEYMILSKYDFFSTMLYGFMIINFEFSNLRIIQSITFIFILLLFSYLFLKLKRNSKDII